VKYDDAGYMLYTQDPLKRMTRFIDDAMGRQTQATDPSTAVTGQSFDADGNRSTLTNANLNATQLGFDTSDRLTNVVTPGKPATSFTYNNRNQIFSQTLPIGSTTIMGYDANVRLTTSVDPVGAIAYGYDGSGRLLTDTEVTSSATNTLTRQYDLLGRLTNFTDGSGNVIGYTYDANNNLKTLTYPDKTQVTYGYDAANRLQTVKDWSNRITTYGYDHDGRVLTITRPDGSVETNSYDAAGQVLSSQDSVGSNAIQSIGYGYNLMGSVTSEKFTPFVATVSSTNLSLSVNADNSLATINSKSVGYDLNGNMLSAIIPGSAITSLTYDARNRLTSAGGLTYGYDSENHRISVTSNSAVTSFVVNPNATLDQVLVKNVNGTKTKYVYGLGLIGEETGGSFTTYHYDHRGSTTALTDINGNVLKRFCYGPHGEPVGFNPATAPTQFLYCGRWGVATDANGLVNMRARYYLPAISRFVNQDVLLGGIVPGISMNRFAYANGDPVNGIDPFGLDQILLNDTTAVGIHFGNFKLTAGHIAKLIQNKNGGWTYVSKDGGAFGVAGKASKTFADYESLASFYSSSNAARYDRSAIIRTTSDQDASALAAMEASAASYYCVIGRSCLTATMAGDSADGLPVDSGLLVPNTYFSNFIESGDAKQIDPSTVLFNWNNPNLNQGEVVLGVNSPHQTAGNTSSCN